MRNIFLSAFLLFSTFLTGKSQNREVPEWANFFNKKEYNLFINYVEKYFKSKNIKIKIEDGVVYPEKNDFNLDGFYGLLNLAQDCKQDDSKLWQEIINSHYEKLIESAKFDKQLREDICDFNKVKQYLGVRIYSKDYIDNVIDIKGENSIILKYIADDLVEMLIFDQPSATTNVKPEDIQKWNKSEDELFEIGFNNIKEKYPLEIKQEDMVKGQKLWTILSEQVFTANILLDKPLLSKYIGSKGAIIGVPDRHMLLIYPIENSDVQKVIFPLIYTISNMFKDGPWSISDKMYWYHDGKMTDLPYEIVNDAPQFNPPKEFVDVVKSLK